MILTQIPINFDISLRQLPLMRRCGLITVMPVWVVIRLLDETTRVSTTIAFGKRVKAGTLEMESVVLVEDASRVTLGVT